MLVVAGPAVTLVIVVILQVVFTFALASLDIGPSFRKDRPPQRLSEAVVDGLRYIIQHRGVRLQFMLLIAAALLAKPITDLLPGFASETFSRGADGLAWLFALHGVGAASGGFWLSFRGKLEGLVGVGAAAILAVSAALMGFAATSMFWIAGGLLVIIGFCTVVIDISNQTLIQSVIRSRYRGRTMSTYGMVAQGAPSIGALIMGFSASQFGLGPPIFVGAVLCLIVGVMAWLNRSRIEASLDKALDDRGRSL